MLREIVGILLAAGNGSRFGGDKLRYRMPDGTPLGVSAAVNLHPACERLVAVLRPNDNELASMMREGGCEIIFCPEAYKGMGHSLAAGVRATAEASAWIVALGDMPFIQTATHQAVAESLKSGASLVATQYQERRGHPVGFSSIWLPQLVTVTGDQGGKAILTSHSEQLTLCSVDDPGVLRDIDRPEDLSTFSADERIKCGPSDA